MIDKRSTLLKKEIVERMYEAQSEKTDTLPEYDLVLETSAFNIYEMTSDRVRVVSGNCKSIVDKVKNGIIPRGKLDIVEYYGDEIFTAGSCDLTFIVSNDSLTVDGVQCMGNLYSFSIRINEDGSIGAVRTFGYVLD